MWVTGNSNVKVSSQTITTITNVLLVSVQVVGSNPSRQGLRIWNNSANSVYLCTESPATSSIPFAIVATFTAFEFTQINYTGPIYAIRNSGSGNIVVHEFIA